MIQQISGWTKTNLLLLLVAGLARLAVLRVGGATVLTNNDGASVQFGLKKQKTEREIIR